MRRLVERLILIGLSAFTVGAIGYGFWLIAVDAFMRGFR